MYSADGRFDGCLDIINRRRLSYSSNGESADLIIDNKSPYYEFMMKCRDELICKLSDVDDTFADIYLHATGADSDIVQTNILPAIR
jgi:hypothetical protein